MGLEYKAQIQFAVASSGFFSVRKELPKSAILIFRNAVTVTLLKREKGESAP